MHWLMAYKNNKILVIIPARGGSKRLPHKNIKLLNGKPMIAYSIAAALKSKYVDRVVVSTDDKKTARIAKRYKADVPFLRPAYLATDNATVVSVMKHAVNHYQKNENYNPDLVVLMHLTTPLVLADDIDKAIEKITQTKANSCISICEISERPEWMFKIKEGDKAVPFIRLSDEKHSSKQMLPQIFKVNGAVYVTRIDILMKKSKIIDENSLVATFMPRERSVDVDELMDFKLAGVLMRD